MRTLAFILSEKGSNWRPVNRRKIQSRLCFSMITPAVVFEHILKGTKKEAGHQLGDSEDNPGKIQWWFGLRWYE